MSATLKASRSSICTDTFYQLADVLVTFFQIINDLVTFVIQSFRFSMHDFHDRIQSNQASWET
jgi:hypothetical protein